MGARASIAPPGVAVPGNLTGCDVRVENTSAVAGTFTLAVAGPAAQWAWVAPPSLDLGPGASAGARIVVRLPRSPAFPAGPLPLILEVRSATPRAGEAVVATAHAVVEVAPFADVVATVEPRIAGASRVARYTVTLENRGNAPTRAIVDAVDPDDALYLTVEPDSVDLAIRAVGTAVVTARPQSSFLLGPSRPRPFTIVTECAGAQPVEVGATLDQRPAVPRSAFAAVVAVVGLALAASLLAGGRSLPAEPALPEDRPDPTCIGRDHLASESNGVVRPELTMPVSWSFLRLAADGCTPMRFNPCQPIHYVTSGARAGSADRADLAEALARVSEATGVEFVHDGEVPDDPGLPARPAVVTGPDGARWAPVHIAWVGQDAIGRARALAPPGGGQPGASTTTVPDIGIPGAGLPVESGGVHVTGLLLLNVDAVSDLRTGAAMPHGFGRGPSWGRVLLHELGHLLGLGHVQSTANLMHHQLGAHTSPSATFGTGDRIGLDAVGRKAGCIETPAAAVPGGVRG